MSVAVVNGASDIVKGFPFKCPTFHETSRLLTTYLIIQFVSIYIANTTDSDQTAEGALFHNICFHDQK